MLIFRLKLTQTKHNHTYALKKLKFICILHGRSLFLSSKTPKYIKEITIKRFSENKEKKYINGKTNKNKEGCKFERKIME